MREKYVMKTDNTKSFLYAHSSYQKYSHEQRFNAH